MMGGGVDIKLEKREVLICNLSCEIWELIILVFVHYLQVGGHGRLPF